LTDSTKDTSYSLFEKDVFIYLLKGSIAGLILAASTYKAHLIAEYSNENKANAELSKANVKVEYYEDLKALAEDSKRNGKSDLFKEFNEKHKLAYKLALNDVEVAKKASQHSGKVLELIGNVSQLIVIVSYFIFLVSGAILMWNSRELNKNKQEFTIKNGEIKLLKSLLAKEINAVKKNKNIDNKTIKQHQNIFDKLPGNIQIDGVNNQDKKSKEFWPAVILGLVLFGITTYLLVRLF